jgi:sugar phosphate isomerase/epimerase
MIHPGLVSITFRKLSPAEIVSLVRKAGLRGIEWGGDIHVPHGDIERAREVRAMTAESGLRVAAYGSYYRAGWSEANGLPFRRVLDSALELGAPSIRVWPGVKGSADVDEAGRWAVIEDLRRIAEMAGQVGVRVATEFHGSTLTDTNESASQLLVEVDHPNLHTGWQPHNGEATADCVEGLQAVAPRLDNIHVFHWWPTSADRHPLADGTERWAEFWRVLRTLPGERFALLEFVPGDTEAAFLRDAATLLSWLGAYGRLAPIP